MNWIRNKTRNEIIANILLLCGLLLIIIGFIQLFSTLTISRWLSGEITEESVVKFSKIFILNQIIIGFLMIPFGVSTLFIAAGVRAGSIWARNIAIANSIAVVLAPLIITILSGPKYHSELFHIIMGIVVVVIGLIMFISLIWLWSDSSATKQSR